MYRALVERGDHLIVTVDRDTRIRFANAACQRLLGRPVDELLGRAVTDIVHPDDQGLALELLGRTGAEPVPAVVRLVHADGSWRRIAAIATDLHDDVTIRGTVISGVQIALGDEQLLASSDDGTDLGTRRDAAELHPLGEQHWHALVESTSDIITIVAPDGSWRTSNTAVTRLLGWPPRQDTDPEGMLVDVHPDDRDLARAALAKILEGHEALGEPMVVRVRAADGTWHYLETRARNLVHDPAVRGYVVTSHDITELKRTQELLEHQATHDPLTNLPNRTLFEELGEQAVARSQRDRTTVAVLFLDLDGFKDVNDAGGHALGDELLVQIAHRLRASVRRGDAVARFGGDEFVILCEHPAGGAEMLQLARRLIEAVSRPVFLRGQPLRLGASVGIAIGGGAQATIDALLRDADAALYQAKSHGRGRAMLFGEPAPG